DESHTGGTRPELLAAAQKTGVQIVMLTDHVRPERDFIDDSWRGMHDGVLFIPGAEHEGFLSYPTKSIRAEKWSSQADYIKLVRSGGGLIFLSHVEDHLDWPTAEVDGLEIYNHHTDVKDEGAFTFWLQGSLTDAVRLPLLVKALEQYPEEVFGAQQDYLTEIIDKWDRENQQRPLTAVAANDCHHNQVFTVIAIDDNTVEVGYITSRPTTTRVSADKVPSVAELVKGRRHGELIAKLDFDPYERSLRYVSTHILARELTERSVREALRSGHAYVSHDWLCDARGFAFVLTPKGAPKAASAVMGDAVSFKPEDVLRVATPLVSRLKLMKNGEVIQTA